MADIFNLGLTYNWVDALVSGSTASIYFAADKVFQFAITGLKPNTQHSFFFEGVNSDTKVKPFAGKIGDQLVSDVQGYLTFSFYYDSGLPDDVILGTSYSLNYSKNIDLLNKVAGKKTCTVKSADGLSKATTQINILAGADKYKAPTSQQVFIDPTAGTIVGTVPGISFPNPIFDPFDIFSGI